MTIGARFSGLTAVAGLAAMAFLSACGGGGDKDLPSYALTVGAIPAEAGTVTQSGSGMYAQGSAATLTPVPTIPGWAFSEWTGDLTGSANPGTVTMDAAKSVTAVFRLLHSSWTWAGGPDHDSSPGVFGAKGTPSSTATPGARRRAASWTDSSGLFWMFGGAGYSSSPTQMDSSLDDLWSFDPVTREWTWFAGSDTSAAPAYAGTPGEEGPANTPGARDGSCAWGGSSGSAWVFGGVDMNGALRNDLWRFSLSSHQWALEAGDSSSQNAHYGTLGEAGPAARPGARKGAASFKGSDGTLWLFGGHGIADGDPAPEGDLNDLWRFDPATRQWAWMGGTKNAGEVPSFGATPAPGALDYPAFWTDLAGDFWLYGGTPDDDSRFSAEMWKLDHDTLLWTHVLGSYGLTIENQPPLYGTLGVEDPGNWPGSRMGSAVWTDSLGDLWLYGGESQDGYRSDLWRFSPASGQWAWMGGVDSIDGDASPARGTMGAASTANHPGNRRQAMAWTAQDGKLWLFGGFDMPIGTMGDLWVYVP